jgi:hypothetical protein
MATYFRQFLVECFAVPLNGSNGLKGKRSDKNVQEIGHIKERGLSLRSFTSNRC